MRHNQWCFFRISKCHKWGSPRQCLGTILFLIYINDLPGTIAAIMKLFVDDAKVY